MKIVKNVINSALICLLLGGCCVVKPPIQKRECQLQKANDKIIVLTQKFPELIQPNDTIFLRDTIQINDIRIDTTFVDIVSFDNGIRTDTIEIIKEKLKIQYIKKDSLVYIEGECIGDTIYIEKSVPIDRIVVEKPTFPKQVKDWTWFILVIIIGVILIRKFGKEIFNFLK